jgi:EpsI family protein
MESPLIEDHLWQGWAIFTLLMIPTYFVVRWIERRDARLHGDETLPLAAVATFDRTRPRRAALAGAVAIVGPVFYLGLGLVPAIGELDRSPQVLDLVEGWTAAERGPADPGWTPSYRGIDARVQWTVSGPGTSVEAGRYFFADQRQGEELIQWDNAMAPDSLSVSERLIGPVGERRRYVREAIFFADGAPRIAWYWYRVAGLDTPFPSRAKLLEVPAFVLRRPAAELVTLSAPCGPEDCADAARALWAAVQGVDED